MNVEAGPSAQEPLSAQKRVLNAGSGPYSPKKLHSVFYGAGWKEVRLDIDPQVKPDLTGSITDLSQVIPERSFDAVWSSHNVEHLYAHEVKPALTEFRRILKPDGFALITCPDLEAVARLVLEGGPEKPVYTSPAGPITALDMLFGHSASIERGNTFMAHNTGFTREQLGNLLLECGFTEAWVTKGRMYDLWAVALMHSTNAQTLQELFASRSDLNFGAVGGAGLIGLRADTAKNLDGSKNFGQ